MRGAIWIILADLAGILDEVYPPRWSEPWDNSGLTVGRMDATIKRVLVALDVTAATVGEALAKSCDLLLTHHPFPWRERKRYDLAEPEIGLLHQIMASGLNLFSVHTNLDAAPHGHAAWLANELGLTDPKPLKPAAEYPALTDGETGVGLGRHGQIEPLDFAQLVARLRSILGSDRVLTAGAPRTLVERVAICPGSAGDLLPYALAVRADVLIGGEFSHHDALTAAANQMGLIDAGHYATEVPALSILERICAERTGGEIMVFRADGERDPFQMC